MRPVDGEAWFVLVNAPRHSPGGRLPGTIDWDAPGLADSYADKVLASLAGRGTDLTGRILWRELRTPADLERATGAPGGAIYGTSSNGARAAFLRPQNASSVPGLFLVGGSAHPGGGLPLVGMSAEIVANLVGRA
jgi:phytoene dehydrogenase-like protein